MGDRHNIKLKLSTLQNEYTPQHQQWTIVNNELKCLNNYKLAFISLNGQQDTNSHNEMHKKSSSRFNNYDQREDQNPQKYKSQKQTEQEYRQSYLQQKKYGGGNKKLLEDEEEEEKVEEGRREWKEGRVRREEGMRNNQQSYEDNMEDKEEQELEYEDILYNPNDKKMKDWKSREKEYSPQRKGKSSTQNSLNMMQQGKYQEAEKYYQKEEQVEIIRKREYSNHNRNTTPSIRSSRKQLSKNNQVYTENYPQDSYRNMNRNHTEKDNQIVIENISKKNTADSFRSGGYNKQEFNNNHISRDQENNRWRQDDYEEDYEQRNHNYNYNNSNNKQKTDHNAMRNQQQQQKQSNLNSRRNSHQDQVENYQHSRERNQGPVASTTTKNVSKLIQPRNEYLSAKNFSKSKNSSCNVSITLPHHHQVPPFDQNDIQYNPQPAQIDQTALITTLVNQIFNLQSQVSQQQVATSLLPTLQANLRALQMQLPPLLQNNPLYQDQNPLLLAGNPLNSWQQQMLIPQNYNSNHLSPQINHQMQYGMHPNQMNQQAQIDSSSYPLTNEELVQQQQHGYPFQPQYHQQQHVSVQQGNYKNASQFQQKPQMKYSTGSRQASIENVPKELKSVTSSNELHQYINNKNEQKYQQEQKKYYDSLQKNNNSHHQQQKQQPIIVKQSHQRRDEHQVPLGETMDQMLEKQEQTIQHMNINKLGKEQTLTNLNSKYASSPKSQPTSSNQIQHLSQNDNNAFQQFQRQPQTSERKKWSGNNQTKQNSAFVDERAAEIEKIKQRFKNDLDDYIEDQYDHKQDINGYNLQIQNDNKHQKSEINEQQPHFSYENKRQDYSNQYHQQQPHQIRNQMDTNNAHKQVINQISIVNQSAPLRQHIQWEYEQQKTSNENLQDRKIFQGTLTRSPEREIPRVVQYGYSESNSPFNQQDFMPQHEKGEPYLIQNNQQTSLADAFKNKKQNLVEKLEDDKRRKDRQKTLESRQQPKTKEELYQIRKELLQKGRNREMKSASRERNQRTQQEEGDYNDKKMQKTDISDIFPSNHQIRKSSLHKGTNDNFQKNNSLNSTNKFKDPPPELINRLIYGLKAKVDEKDYKKLTCKNYEQLPEVKKKKEDAQKKQEMADRMKMKKEYEQKLRYKVKNMTREAKSPSNQSIYTTNNTNQNEEIVSSVPYSTQGYNKHISSISYQDKYQSNFNEAPLRQNYSLNIALVGNNQTRNQQDISFAYSQNSNNITNNSNNNTSTQINQNSKSILNKSNNNLFNGVQGNKKPETIRISNQDNYSKNQKQQQYDSYKGSLKQHNNYIPKQKQEVNEEQYEDILY